MNHPTVAALAGLRAAFLALQSTGELADLLAVPLMRLIEIAANPHYFTFEVPKKSGDMRLIEDPDDRLQAVQSDLNNFLQAVYWPQRSAAAYGFLVSPTDNPDPRHIESNASRHLGKEWLLNCDLEDFFHQITEARVRNLYRQKPFEFDEEMAVLLTQLTTYRGRCPMGAPTSPVLSNLVFQATDEALLELAHRRGWTYTRYADDMSFSSNEPISWDDYKAVQHCAGKQGYAFNPSKAKIFGPIDQKTITGLVLGPEGLEIPPDFIPEVADDIRQLAGAVTVQFRMHGRSSQSLDRFRRSIEGKIRFTERIMGEKHPGVTKLWNDYRLAATPPPTHEMRSWLDFDYL